MVRKLNNSLGFYLSGFFRLHIKTNNSIKNVDTLSDYDFALFLHEYTHFLQDITTYYGLNNIHISVDYLKFASRYIVDGKIKEFDIPIEPDPRNLDNVLLNGQISNVTFGDADSCYVKEIIRIDKVFLPLDVPGCTLPDIEVIDVTFIDSTGTSSVFTFGAGCIIESMSYLMEKLTYRNYVKSPDIPYASAELLVNHIYPEFGRNKLNVLALCDISLGSSNPGSYFVSILEEWKRKMDLPSDPKILYDEYRSTMFTLNGGGDVNTDSVLTDISMLAREQLRDYFNDPEFDELKLWIDEVIESSLNLRLSNPYFIIEMANYDIKNNLTFREVYKKIGTPLMTNNNKEFRFYHPLSFNKQVDIGYFWAISQIHEIFFGSDPSCDLIEFCKTTNRNIQTDLRCIEEPWNRCSDKDLCSFGIFWKHWGLMGSRPKIAPK
jgi:hypothetical protein